MLLRNCGFCVYLCVSHALDLDEDTAGRKLTHRIIVKDQKVEMTLPMPPRLLNNL